MSIRIWEGGIKRIVLTGGPGTGKSTLLEALGRKEHAIHRENARAWIAAHKHDEKAPMPWRELERFSEKMIEAGIQSYESALPGSFNFYDRGLPDTLAYLRLEQRPIPAEWISLMSTYRYEDPIFVAPPWESIYCVDGERTEDFETTMRIHDQLIEVYDSLGYQWVELPLATVEERLDFVMHKLS